MYLCTTPSGCGDDSCGNFDINFVSFQAVGTRFQRWAASLEATSAPLPVQLAAVAAPDGRHRAYGMSQLCKTQVSTDQTKLPTGLPLKQMQQRVHSEVESALHRTITASLWLKDLVVMTLILQLVAFKVVLRCLRCP